MKRTNKLIIIFSVLMVIFALTSLFKIEVEGKELDLASITLIIGIVAFFVTRKENDDISEGLNFKTAFGMLKDKKTAILVLMPMIMNIVCFLTAKLLVPDFIIHLKSRTGFLSFNMIPVLIIELIIAALGEEIAWRAFFQKQVSKIFPFVPSLIISSALFSICHFNSGSIIVVVYDLLFIFINAIFYGMVFQKTDNACVSTIAHFLANLLGTAAIVIL